MTDRINIKLVKKQGEKNPYYVEELNCPKSGIAQSPIKCKTCKHCRIHLGSYVKCSYSDDKRREELRPETIV